MSTGADYQPSPSGWVRDQVERILASGDSSVVGIDGRHVVLITMRGKSSGKVRKVPVMRVVHASRYAAVGSLGGAPKNPKWVAHLRANPDVEVLDGTRTLLMRARELKGAERDEWWARAVEAFPAYRDYQTRTDRVLPVFLLEPR